MKRTASNNPGFVLGSHPSEDLSTQDNYRVHIRVTVGFRKLQSAAWAFSVYKKTFLFRLVFEPVYGSVRVRRLPVNAIPGETDSFMCAPAANNYLRPLTEDGIQKLITYSRGTKKCVLLSHSLRPLLRISQILIGVQMRLISKFCVDLEDNCWGGKLMMRVNTGKLIAWAKNLFFSHFQGFGLQLHVTLDFPE